MADAPLCMVFCGCFDRFMIAYGVFPVNPTKFHNKTRAKCTKTGSVFLWSTSVLAKGVTRKKQETRPRGEPRLGCSLNWDLVNCFCFKINHQIYGATTANSKIVLRIIDATEMITPSRTAPSRYMILGFFLL